MAQFHSSTIPSLPPNCEFSYLNEGAANIVYKIRLIPSTPPPTIADEYGAGTPPPTEIDDVDADSANIVHSEFSSATHILCSPFPDKLLRVRKNIGTPKCADAQSYWEQYIRPLFNPSDIVIQSLFHLEPALVTRLNEELQAWEMSGRMKNLEGVERARLAKRVGKYLEKDEHGLLVTDMTPGLCISFGCVVFVTDS